MAPVPKKIKVQKIKVSGPNGTDLSPALSDYGRAGNMGEAAVDDAATLVISQIATTNMEPDQLA